MSFDHGSTSDTDSQMPCNNIHPSAQTWLPVYSISSSSANVEPLHHPGHAGLTIEWSLGETSSTSAAQSQHHHSENEKDRAWSAHPHAALPFDESRHEPSHIHSMDNVDDVDKNGNQTASGSSLLPTPGPDALHPYLNLHLKFANDNCQVGRRSKMYLSVGSSDGQIPSTSSSSESLGMPSEFSGLIAGEGEDGPGGSMDGQCISCKRKAHEIHAGQSSGAGGSNSFQPAAKSQRYAVPAGRSTQRRIGVLTQTENELVDNNESEESNPRLRLGFGRAISATPYSFTRAAPGDSSGRNFNLSFSGLPPQDHEPRNSSSIKADVGNVDVSSSHHALGLAPCNNRLLDTNSAPQVEDRNLLNIPSGHQNPQSRWGGASSSRTSSLSALTNSQDRDFDCFEESASRNIPRSVSEHPVFVPEMGSTSQQPNWTFYDGSTGIAGNAASTSWAGSSSRVDPSASAWSNWSRPQYNRRISDIVRRSLLSSAGAESGVQESSHTAQSGSSAASQEIAILSGSGSHIPHLSNSRSALLERRLDGDFRMSYLLRNLAAAGEGSSAMSEHIRDILHLTRRGEGLRFEDMMMLDHPVFFGMVDVHDRHRDMRLDVDNMSYEELLALEEHIGDVCTGLTEETITSRLKRKKCTRTRSNTNQPDTTEPCSICREEYNDGESIGTLECDHDFHADCIKHWLIHKNLCPICKQTGLIT